MKDNRNNIDDVFRGKVYDYSSPPPESVWTDIEKSLSDKRKKKVVYLYFKIAAGFIFLAGLTAFFLKVANNQQTNVKPGLIAAKPDISVSNQIEKPKTIAAGNKQVAMKRSAGKETPSVKNNNVSDVITESHILAQDTTSLYEKEEISTTSAIIKNEELTRISAIDPTLELRSNSQPIEKKDTTKTPAIIPNPNDALFDDLLASEESGKGSPMVWMVGGQAGPQYTYRRLTEGTQASVNNVNYDNYDSPMLAYAGGLQIEVEPVRRLSVQSGVYYSKVGQNISSRYVEASKTDYFPENMIRDESRPVEIVNSIGTLSFPDKTENSPKIIDQSDYNLAFPPVTAISNEKADFSGQQYFEFIEIPLILRYKVIDQKFGVNIIGGMNTDIMVNNYAKIESEYVTLESSTNNVRTFNYSGTVGFGFEYPLSDKVLFNMEPFFKYYLTPINKSTTTDAHPYMFGIMTGVSYSF